MNNQAFIVLSTIIIFFSLVGLLFSLLYMRATKNRAYIRTGYGGEKIILNTGAFALPMLHKVIPVSLSTKRVEIRQSDENSVMTKDRLRADIAMDFYLTVEANETAVALAAQTLGIRTLNVTDLQALIEGKLIDAIRTAAAEFSMSELQKQCRDFVEQVKDLTMDHVMKNGLKLETVSLRSIDQTNKTFFNWDNVFDAEGLTNLTRRTQEEKQICNEIEQKTTVEIKRKQMESDRLILEMEKEKIDRKSAQDRDLDAVQAAQKMEKIKTQSKQKLEEEQAKILTAQEIKMSEQIKTITLAEKSKEQSKIQAEANLAMAETVNSEEQVVTARELAKATRQKQIDLIEASVQAEREAMSITSNAAAKKNAANDLAEATRIQAQSQAQAYQTIADGKKQAEITATESLKTFYQTHVDGIQSLIGAFNTLSKEKIPLELRLEILNHIPKISPDGNGDPSKYFLTKGMNQEQSNDHGKGSPSTYENDPNAALEINDQNAEVKSSKIRNIISDAHQSVLQEAISTLNEMSGDPNILNISNKNTGTMRGPDPATT